MENKKQEPKDPQLDTPSVANEDKHINFLKEDENARRPAISMDIRNRQDEQRQKEWKKGIEEGKKEQPDQPHFQKRDLNEQEEY